MCRVVAVTDAARSRLTELMLLAAAAEANSEHPIAKARLIALFSMIA